MRKKLIGNNIDPKCDYCKFSVSVQGAETLLCPNKGVVSGSDRCKKFKYDPLKRKPRSAPALSNYSEEDFSLD